MKNNKPIQEEEIDALSPAWVGLFAVATSVSPDNSFDDKTLAAIKNNLLKKIRVASPKAAAPDHQIILKDADWKILSPKLQVKVLWNDGINMSWLLRMLPGTTIPAHVHDGYDEECLVMEGSVRLDGKTLNAGDYTVAVRGSDHYDIYSKNGCVLFLKSPASHEETLPTLREE